LLCDPAISGEVTSVWQPEKFSIPSKSCLSEEFRKTFLSARETLDRELDYLSGEFHHAGRLTVAGHSHIDYAWLWPLEETRRKIRRTFANAVRLSEKYGDFVYSQSSAAMYRDILESDPDLFEKIEKLVAEGRWEPIGGMWVESDTNLTSGESLVRQFLYGQKFFYKYFGKVSRTVWLPDVFGFTWILPQIMKKSGMNYFVTTKINWNEKNRPQRDLFKWRGIDGSEVIYHSFDNPGNGYNGVLGPKDILATFKNHRDKVLSNETIFSFGYGDGGGGPTDEMLENFEFLKSFPGMPELVMRPFEEYFVDLQDSGVDLPVHDGELYLELHRGTYTSQGRTKMFHKLAEDALYLAELLGAPFGYDPEEMEKLWRVLLHNEFHDILPGSSIREVYRDAEEELFEVRRKALEFAEKFLKRYVKAEAGSITVFNPGSFDREIFLSLNDNRKIVLEDTDLAAEYDALDIINDRFESFFPHSPESHELDYQVLSNGDTLYAYNGKIEATGFVTLKVLDERVESGKSFSSSDNTLNNYLLEVTVDSDGLTIYDLELQRDVLKDKAGLYIFKDVPTYWDGWDIERDYHLSGERLIAKQIEKTESGPLRESIRAVFDCGPTRIIQDITLDRNSRRLDISNTIDWHMRRTMLRALFPLYILTREARYDLSCGYITRSTTENNSIQEAAFEVPGHRWVDLSEYGYGVSILNNGKYGYGVRGSNVSLNLLRSPVFPDFFADEGRHEFTYSIYPHEGSDLLGTVREAEYLNRQLITLEGFSNNFPIVSLNAPTMKIMALKMAENGKGVILRVAEVLGARGVAVIDSPFHNKDVWLTNLLEERQERITNRYDRTTFAYEPFGIYTILFDK
jgi:alpha-mannosidase